tara:strand:+ start:134 stop:292 length:159 start_codon:yes stop_codon:yes gene_type:complete
MVPMISLPKLKKKHLSFSLTTKTMLMPKRKRQQFKTSSRKIKNLDIETMKTT